MKALSIVVLCLIGIGISQATAPAEVGISGSKVQQPQSSAPRVTCTIKMNFWCVVQADASLNMTEIGDYRIWKMTAPGNKREVVTVRESKSCDSPADLRPRRKSERDERMASGERRHIVDLAMSADGTCTLQVEYLAGATDLAREAKQMAKYRLYLCDGDSCRRPLLDIK